MKTNDLELQKELKEVLQQQIELTDNKEQKIKLLTKLQKITENLLKEHPNDIIFKSTLISVLQEQLKIVEDKNRKNELLETFRQAVNSQPNNTITQKFINSIYDQLRVMKKPNNRLLNELKDQIDRLEKNKTALKGDTLNSSIANFNMLLHVCPSNEDNYEHMIKLLEMLNKKNCPEHVTTTLIKCLQLHFLEIKIKNPEKYCRYLKMLFNIIDKYLTKESNQTADFVKFTFEYVTKRNNLQAQNKESEILNF